MGADKVLVEGAYRAAMAKVPGDYSKHYWQKAMSNVGALKSFVKTGTDYMAHVYKLNEETKAKEALRKKAESNEFNKFEQVVSKNARRIGSYERGGKGEGLHEDVYNFYLDWTEDLKRRYKEVSTTGDDDTPENKKERNAIWGELQANINEVKGITDNIFAIGALNEKKQLSAEGMGGAKAMYNYNQILNMDEDWSNVTLEKTKKEGLTFVVDGSGYIDPLTGKSAGWGKERIPASKLMENIVPKAHGQETWWLKQNGKVEERVLKAAGKGKTSTFDFQSEKDSIKTNMLTDEKALRDIANRSLHGSTESIRDIFLSNPELQTVFNKDGVFLNLPNTLANQIGDGDDFVTEEEFYGLINVDNREIIANA